MHFNFHGPIRIAPITFFVLLLLGWFPAKSNSSPHPTLTTEQQICPFEIAFTVSGLSVTATLVSPNPVLPPSTVKWFLGGGQFIGTGAEITYTFPVAGTYEICAQYEFDNQICNTCTSLSVITGLCIDSSLINPSIFCPAIFDPVCGCDGNTYSNACVALNHHGVTSWIPGACAGGNPCLGLTAGFSAAPSANNPLSIHFQDQSAMPNGQIVGWKWEFGDGATSNDQNPVHTFAAAGDYNVCLMVTALSVNGGSTCTEVYCQNITVVNGCVDHCIFHIDHQVSGLQLNANLLPFVPDVLSPDSVVWTLNGEVVEHGPLLSMSLPEPGKYFLCAKYITADGAHCEVCSIVKAKSDCVIEHIIDPTKVCPTVFEPVCGCDGETYSNACEALYHHGISSWHKGQCNTVGSCNDLQVDFQGFNSGGSLTFWSFNSQVTFPGSTSFTYHWDFGNGQFSNQENPSLNFLIPGEYVVCLTVTANSLTGGICSATTCHAVIVGEFCIDPGLINLNEPCPAVYAPVCGCDGVTYENECVAKIHHGVTSWTQGPCAGACIDPDCIDPLVLCSNVYDPVCGCDGVTYNNDCIAVYVNGVTSWKKGPCCTVSCDSLKVDFNQTVDATDSLKLFFHDQSQFPGGPVIGYFWTFGDGATSTEQNPDHHYAEAGEYYVCLKIKVELANGENCAKELCKTIKVGNDCEDVCDFNIQYTLNGVQLHAWLQLTTAQIPGIVKWTVNGENIGTGPNLIHIVHSFPEPGLYTLCAQYEALNGDICTVCKVMEVTALCIDEQQIDPTVACTAIYDPVCGCDGVTYSNACEAEKHHGVTSWTPGECGSFCNGLFVDFQGFNSGGSLTVYTFNPQIVLPGIGTVSWFWDFGNGTTSTLQDPTINFQQPGTYQVCLTVQVSTPNGTTCTSTVCKSIDVAAQLCIDHNLIDTTAVCPTVYDPVCGCDGVTYDNKCIAVTYHGVTSWTPGICPDACINPAWADPTALCPEIFDPVCGCDGNTYKNSCEAQRNFGVTSWEKGPCCNAPECKAFFKFEILPGNTVIISDLSVQAEIWHLNLGDGTQHSGYFNGWSHTYAQPGIYEICLEISNFAGTCTDKYCVLVDFSATGTQQPNHSISIQMAPNPANQFTRVTIGGATPVTSTLIDLYGQSVWTSTAPGLQFEVPLTGLPAGIYMLAVQTEKGTVVRKLVVGRI